MENTHGRCFKSPTAIECLADTRYSRYRSSTRNRFSSMTTRAVHRAIRANHRHLPRAVVSFVPPLAIMRARTRACVLIFDTQPATAGIAYFAGRGISRRARTHARDQTTRMQKAWLRAMRAATHYNRIPSHPGDDTHGIRACTFPILRHTHTHTLSLSLSLSCTSSLFIMVANPTR